MAASPMASPEPEARELEAFRREVEAWFRANRPPDPGFLLPESFLEVGTDEQFAYLRDWQRKVYEAGYLGMAWPREYGGGGLPQAWQDVVNAEMARQKVPFMPNTIGLNWAGPLILAVGTEAQKRQYIRNILSAEDIWCQGFSEPDNGSDLAATQTRADRLREMRDALAVMAETAARCYEIETGRAFIPASNGRKNSAAHLTGAVFEARQWLEQHERQEAAQFQMDGTPLALAGDRDWTDHARIWDTLDAIQVRFRESFASSLILYHKGDKWGADAIAAAWAKSRKVPQTI